MESKEVNLTKIHEEKYYDRNEHGVLISQVTNDNPPLEKLSDPPKLILEPLSCGLEYIFLGDNEDIIPYEEINPLVCKPNRYYEKDDPRHLHT